MTHQVLRGLGLAALAAVAGASPLVSKPDDTSSSSQVEAKSEPAASGQQPWASASPDLGGALYSPFSTATGTTDTRSDTSARPTRHDEGERVPGIAVAVVTAFVATGFLVALMRALIGR